MLLYQIDVEISNDCAFHWLIDWLISVRQNSLYICSLYGETSSSMFIAWSPVCPVYIFCMSQIYFKLCFIVNFCFYLVFLTVFMLPFLYQNLQLRYWIKVARSVDVCGLILWYLCWEPWFWSLSRIPQEKYPVCTRVWENKPTAHYGRS